MTALLGLFSGAWAKLAAVAAAIGGVLLIGWRLLASVKASGRREQALEDANAGLAGRLEAKEKVQDARTEIDLLAPDDRLARLREHERRARGG